MQPVIFGLVQRQGNSKPDSVNKSTKSAEEHLINTYSISNLYKNVKMFPGWEKLWINKSQ